jgi:antirestriction protein ArdC
MAIVRREFFDQVTNGVIAQLDQGVRPWVRPWTGGNAGQFIMPRRHNGARYRGINVLLLWAAAEQCGYTESTWMTVKQANALGGRVRKGEHGSTIIFAERVTQPASDAEDGEEEGRSFLLMRSYKVFNVQQIDELPEQYRPKPQPVDAAKPPIQLLENAERFIVGTGAVIRHGQSGAFYQPSGDFIGSPDPQQFTDGENYAATIFHELIHWTSHLSRLARDLGRKRWGDAGYAMEELVAELGAAFLCGLMGIRLEARSDHASYIASWLKVLKEDRRAIFAAAAMAQTAVDYLYSLQPALEQPGSDAQMGMAA